MSYKPNGITQIYYGDGHLLQIFNCAGLQVQLEYEDNRVLGEWATTSCKNKAGSVCKGIISEKNPKPPGSACPLTESDVFQPYR